MLAVIGVLYGACLALVQRDFWRLIAYAALSHFGLIVLAIYGFTFTGWSGAVYQILSHGVVDAALFLLLGAIELRYGTSVIDSFGGLAARIPRAATYFVIATLAMIGLPMLSGFIGEFIILSSTFTGVSRGWAVAAALGVILGAAYMLSLVQRLFYGPESQLISSKPGADLGFGELAVLTPLVVLMLVMGLAPNLWLNLVQTAAHPPAPPTLAIAIRTPQAAAVKPVIPSGGRQLPHTTAGNKAVILSGGRSAAAAEGSALVPPNANANRKPAPEAHQ